MVLMGMDIPWQPYKRQIASAIDIIIHVGRLRDRSRKVLEIVEVLDYEDREIRQAVSMSFRRQNAGGQTASSREGGRGARRSCTQKITFSRISDPMSMLLQS